MRTTQLPDCTQQMSLNHRPCMLPPFPPPAAFTLPASFWCAHFKADRCWAAVWPRLSDTLWESTQINHVFISLLRLLSLRFTFLVADFYYWCVPCPMLMWISLDWYQNGYEIPVRRTVALWEPYDQDSWAGLYDWQCKLRAHLHPGAWTLSALCIGLEGLAVFNWQISSLIIRVCLSFVLKELAR